MPAAFGLVSIHSRLISGNLFVSPQTDACLDQAGEVEELAALAFPQVGALMSKSSAEAESGLFALGG